METGYRKLEIYTLAHNLAVRIHALTLKFPKYELFEEGSQIRRSSKSVASNIVEGYVLRKYKNEFLHYLYRAQGSSEETVQHLRFLHETHSMDDDTEYNQLFESYTKLNAMLFNFINTVEHEHQPPLYLKEDEDVYLTNPD